mgnify:CR=1 FL=1
MVLPKIIYVRLEKETNGNEYLIATEAVDGENGDLVGVYKLTERKRLKITEELI